MKNVTKLIMTASALLLAIIVGGFTFAAPEIANYLLQNSTPTAPLIMQLLGALYFGFAMLNWMARGSIMGGIYNRPIVMANLAHFLIGSLAIIKTMINDSSLPTPVWIIGFFYAIFSILFAVIFFTSPVKK
jgi:hypothetical protein